MLFYACKCLFFPDLKIVLRSLWTGRRQCASSPPLIDELSAFASAFDKYIIDLPITPPRWFIFLFFFFYILILRLFVQTQRKQRLASAFINMTEFNHALVWQPVIECIIVESLGHFSDEIGWGSTGLNKKKMHLNRIEERNPLDVRFNVFTLQFTQQDQHLKCIFAAFCSTLSIAGYDTKQP